MLQSVMKDIANINHEVKVVSRPKQKSKQLWFSDSEDSDLSSDEDQTIMVKRTKKSLNVGKSKQLKKVK